MIRTAITTTCLAALLIGVAGCSGNKNATVSGKITVAGKGPLTGGNITLTPVSDPNKVWTGPIQADGTFKVIDVPRGEYKVSIENESLKAVGPAAPPTESMSGMTGGQAKYIPIDPKYAKAETSGLTLNVDKSEVTFETELSGGKK